MTTTTIALDGAEIIDGRDAYARISPGGGLVTIETDDGRRRTIAARDIRHARSIARREIGA